MRHQNKIVVVAQVTLYQAFEKQGIEVTDLINNCAIAWCLNKRVVELFFIITYFIKKQQYPCLYIQV